MNVVHLDILINIAYGKFSMKVYDIIVQEGIGAKILGVGGKQAARQFATKAEELAFQTAVDKLSNEMVRQLRRGEITDAIHINNPWQHISTDLSGTKWASDKSWMNDMFSAAIKDANERFSQLTANVGTTTKAGSSVANNSVKTAWPTFTSGALKTIAAVGLFVNVKDVLTDPKTGYFPIMQRLTERASSGEISSELFEKFHEEQLRLAAGRLLWTAAPFAFGTVIRLSAFFPVLFTRIFSKRLYGWINKKIVDPIASKFEPGPVFWAGWLSAMAMSQDVKDTITTIVLTEGIKDSAGKSPWLDLSAATVVGTHNIIMAGAGKLSGIAEKSLEMLLNEIEQKAGSAVPNALKSVGLSKTPANTNTAKPTTVQSNTTAPTAVPKTPAEPGEFNPADWRKLKSGMYQQKSAPFSVMHNSEFEDELAKFNAKSQ
jgi:hypothetical protein